MTTPQPQRLSAYAMHLNSKKKPKSSKIYQKIKNQALKKNKNILNYESPLQLIEKKRNITKKGTRVNLQYMDDISNNEVEENNLHLTNTNNNSGCGNCVAEDMFKWLIYPVKPEEFFKENWEKEPLHIKRNNFKYFEGLFSCKDFDKMMRENKLQYSAQVDVLKYENGKRLYDHAETKVNPTFVWDSFQRGNSARHRNPQVYHSVLWKVCSLLQEYFSSVVGVNMYLTPAGSQGFPPHYDDIEAFILQIEGSKHWKVYKPRNENEVLPRYSSDDLKEDDLEEPYMEVLLNAGDMLYFPRGFIHQARTKDTHSLHLTLSTCQLNTWGDLLELALPAALKTAIENNVAFRYSLPKDYLDHIGTLNHSNSSEAFDFKEKVFDLAQHVLKYLDVDHAADAHSVNFIHGCMPPSLNKKEKACSIHGNGSLWKNGQVYVLENFNTDMKIRLIRKRGVRLVMDEDSTKIYYTHENSKNYKEKESMYIEIESECIEGFRLLLQNYPNFIKIDDLPFNRTEKKTYFAEAMYDNGLIMTENPLALCNATNSVENEVML